MYKIAERPHKHPPHRKQRFATDHSSQTDSQHDAYSLSDHHQPYHKYKSKTYPKSNHKINQNLHRMHKFLTETESPSPYVSSDDDDSSDNFKRAGSAIMGEQSVPCKKIKGEEQQVDLNKIVQQSLNFVEKIKNSLHTFKK